MSADIHALMWLLIIIAISTFGTDIVRLYWDACPVDNCVQPQGE